MVGITLTRGQRYSPAPRAYTIQAAVMAPTTYLTMLEKTCDVLSSDDMYMSVQLWPTAARHKTQRHSARLVSYRHERIWISVVV